MTACWKLPLRSVLYLVQRYSLVTSALPNGSVLTMFTFKKFLYSATLVVLCVISINGSESEENHRIRHTRSPTLEVLMHLPPNFETVEEFKSFLGIKPDRRRRDIHSRLKREVLLEEKFVPNGPPVDEDLPKRVQRDAATSESLVGSSPEGPEELSKQMQMETLIPNSEVVDSPQIIVEPAQYPNSLELRRYPNDILQLVEEGPTYEAEDPRKRRNTSANDHEDKRAYPEPSSNGEGTASSSFRKHKTSSPPFITAREGRQNFDQAQHRSNDNARESHSLKDVTKPLSSNEIPRMGDSYYSATNANSRAYSPRLTDPTPPKSVYDSIDYTNRRSQGRNIDGRSRVAYDDYNYNPRPYDRYYYPGGGDVAGRGVEYYHRSMDPSTGRIVYYASLPEPDIYRASRTYNYDPYSRSLPGYPYQSYQSYNPYYPYNHYSSYQPYSFQDFSSRSSRYQQPLQHERYDDPRNKTYVIFDAEEKRTLNAYPTKSSIDRNRYAPPLPYPSFPSPVSYPAYQPYPVYTPYRNTLTSPRSYQDTKGLVRQVELPLTSRSTLKQVTS